MFKVCVRSDTYNHALFIEDAMSGFVMQKTDFPFVTAIIDDASTDDTSKRIVDFFFRNFNTDDSSIAFQEETEYGKVLFAQHRRNTKCFFAIVLLKDNHYSQKKSKIPYLQRWVKDVPYVALCEGDDYWTDPRKLQKQIDFLEEHPECKLSVHASQWMIGDELLKMGCQETEPRFFSVEEMIIQGGLFFSTASFVFRSELQYDWPEWRKIAKIGDFPLELLCGLRGSVHYLPDVMCVYRFLREGSWTNMQRYDMSFKVSSHLNSIDWMTRLNIDTGRKYQKAIFSSLFMTYNFLFYQREIGFREYALAVCKSGDFHKGRVFKDFIRVYFAHVYRFIKAFVPEKKV